MSTTGTRLDLADAQDIAERIRKQIRGEAIAVGSIRRKRPAVGDVEIAVHEKAVVALDVHDPGLFAAEYNTVKGGRLHWRYWQLRHVNGGYTIDLFRFDDLNRGPIMVIRTGPAEFSKRYVVALRRCGHQMANGYLRAVNSETIIPCPDEGDALRYGGMDWIEPEER